MGLVLLDDQRCDTCGADLTGEDHGDELGGVLPTRARSPWFLCCDSEECTCGRGFDVEEFEDAMALYGEQVGWPYTAIGKCQDCQHYTTEDCPLLVEGIMGFALENNDAELNISGCSAFEPDHIDG